MTDLAPTIAALKRAFYCNRDDLRPDRNLRKADAALLEALAKALEEEAQEIVLLGGIKHGRWFVTKHPYQGVTSDERAGIFIPWSAPSTDRKAALEALDRIRSAFNILNPADTFTLSRNDVRALIANMETALLRQPSVAPPSAERNELAEWAQARAVDGAKHRESMHMVQVGDRMLARLLRQPSAAPDQPKAEPVAWIGPDMQGNVDAAIMRNSVFQAWRVRNIEEAERFRPLYAIPPALPERAEPVCADGTPMRWPGPSEVATAPPALPEGLEPPGCPTPGACSCPQITRRAELVALVVSAPNARWRAWAQRRLDNFDAAPKPEER